MDHCRIDDRWQYNGLRAVVMESDLLRVVILADHGAKIHEFVYKPRDRDFLYHNPRIVPAHPVYAANVDNWWTGGLDECIPSGWESHYRGEVYPALGELWSEPWSYEILERGPSEVRLHLWCMCRVAPLKAERWMSIRSGEAVLQMEHAVTNISEGAGDVDFLWGLHPGFAINPDMRIDLPAGSVTVDAASPDFSPGHPTYAWPHFSDVDGRTIDMRFVQGPDTGIWRLHYADLKEGWLSLTDTRARVGIGLVFPVEVFPCSWIWLVYGAWRGLYCAGVEAWNGFPAKLEEAASAGRCSHLDRGQTLKARTRLLVYEDLASVAGIDPQGMVRGF